MEQPLPGGFNNTLNAGATEYNVLVGGTTWNGTEAEKEQLIGADGKIKELRIKLQNAPGAGESYTFTLRVNGANSALTCAVTDANTSNEDLTHEVDVSVGDRVCLMVVPSVGGPATGHAWWGTIFEGSTAKESTVSGHGSDNPNTGSTEYARIQGSSAWLTGWGAYNGVCPITGKITKLYANLTVAPGVGKSYTFTLRDTTDSADTSVVVTISDANTTGNDIAHEATMTPGHRYALKCVPSGTPAATIVRWGFCFEATTDGESAVIGGTSNNMPATATEYIHILTRPAGAWNANEALRYQLLAACQIKNLYVELTGSPGAGKSYVFTVRDDGAGSTLTCSVADANMSANDTTHTPSIAAGSMMALEVNPAGTPTVRDAVWGIGIYIEPVVARIPRHGFVNFQVPGIL